MSTTKQIQDSTTSRTRFGFSMQAEIERGDSNWMKNNCCFVAGEASVPKRCSCTDVDDSPENDLGTQCGTMSLKLMNVMIFDLCVASSNSTTSICITYSAWPHPTSLRDSSIAVLFWTLSLVLTIRIASILDLPMSHESAVTKSKRSPLKASEFKALKKIPRNKRILPAKRRIRRIVESVNATPTVRIVLKNEKRIWKPKGKLSDNSLNKTKQIWKPKGKLSDNSLNKTKQIWKQKGKLSDNSLYKTKRVWKATGKIFADIGYQWRPTGKKLTLGKLDCGSQWRPTGKKFALGEMCHLTKLSVKLEVYVRKNKQTDTISANVFSNKENVIDVDVSNAPKVKVVLCVSCMKNVLIPCHDKCLANYKLNVHSNVRRALFTKPRTPKSLDTTHVVSKTRLSKNLAKSKSLDTTPIVSKTKIDEGSVSKAKNKVSSSTKSMKGILRDILDLVDGLPKFKYGKDHLCSACERGKSKKASYPLKLVPSDHSKLELLYMDLCGPMRVASINGRSIFLCRGMIILVLLGLFSSH
ncbi:hypothetical protein Tco_0156311 [Tanacetum coccineum]